jgi:nucleoside 2-deoxyribosyltransferase
MPEVNALCPICTTNASLLTAQNTRVVCPRCGLFDITGSALAELDGKLLTPRQRANASGWIAESSPSLINTDDLQRIRTLATPSVQSRFDRLLLKLLKESPFLGSPVALDEQSMPSYVAATYSQNEGELRVMVESLISRNLLVGAGGNWLNPALSYAAYAYVDEHLAKNAESPIGFCAMWFNDQVLPLWERAIEPSIDAAGYEPLRLDKHEHNNRIDEEIIASIRRARFLVADLTAHRAGVYFEAGLAMGLGLPVIWMVRDDQLNDTHFDNRQFNFIVWAPDKLDEAMSRLQNRIEATIGKGPRPPSAQLA